MCWRKTKKLQGKKIATADECGFLLPTEHSPRRHGDAENSRRSQERLWFKNFLCVWKDCASCCRYLVDASTAPLVCAQGRDPFGPGGRAARLCKKQFPR